MNTHICLVCGMQFGEHFDRCPQCKYHSVRSKEKVGSRLINEGKWKGYYAISVSHLLPLPCKNCGAEPVSVNHGYRTCCGNEKCGFFLEPFDTWLWNAMAGEDPDAWFIGLEDE